MSTYFPKGEIARKWYVVDADGQTLGRLSTRVARILSGKDNPRYTPFLDTGDHVVVINASKVKLTGLKAHAKVYRHYTGFPGGLREEEFTKRLARKPELIVQEAIEGMLPSQSWAVPWPLSSRFTATKSTRTRLRSLRRSLRSRNL